MLTFDDYKAKISIIQILEDLGYKQDISKGKVCLLYTSTVKSPNIQKGRKATDFGKGFYTTTNFEQAKKLSLIHIL